MEHYLLMVCHVNSVARCVISFAAGRILRNIQVKPGDGEFGSMKRIEDFYVF